MRTALSIGVAMMLSLAATAARAQDAAKPADVEKFMGTWKGSWRAS